VDPKSSDQLLANLAIAERQATLAKQRLQSILQISRKFVQIGDEQKLIEEALHAIVDHAGATGAVFVPLDERGQPLAAIRFGDGPYPIPDDWVEYLATPAVHERCRTCEKGESLNATCPLLKGPFAGTRGLYCLPLQRNGRELGIFNIYIPQPAMLDFDTQDFLRSLVDETSLALDGLRLRKHEKETLQQIQNMSRTALNPQQAAKLEYQTMMDERTRLAREIHDGLAQTLGFLKLQLAQLQGYLERNDIERLRKTLTTSHKAVAEAYQEARYAIDGLRIYPDQTDPYAWARQIVEVFKENLGERLPRVSLAIEDVKFDLPSEIQVQLIRILQEALSNVRIHAQAHNVWIRLCVSGPNLELEISDDGHGFCMEELTGPSQHGLRGMRERAELIGGDFRVISQPQQGTIIRVRLPLGSRRSNI
jgi:signal transduction histidine kinase